MINFNTGKLNQIFRINIFLSGRRMYIIIMMIKDISLINKKIKLLLAASILSFQCFLGHLTEGKREKIINLKSNLAAADPEFKIWNKC